MSASADLVLGHRRLSIVDLAGGSQPMGNEDGTVWVSFNGEIYNHLELREQLEQRGHRFRSRADTEVIVHGFEEWGERLFGRLNGIFAFSIANAITGEVFLVRDPMGVKPLYVGLSRRFTWWVSELAAARAAGVVAAETSPDALKLFLTFRFIPSPYTSFRRAWKIPPGHFVRVTPRTAESEPIFCPYTSDIRSSLTPTNRREWKEALMTELEAAVTRQLMADVPVASLLSGGVDSSLVTMMMADHLPSPPETFGIGFVSDGERSETYAAEYAASELRVPHHSDLIEDEEYIDAWPEALGEIAEPIANSSGLLVRLISKRVGMTHKVVLTGQGADEPLGGYPRHVVERLLRIGRIAPGLSSTATGLLLGSDTGERLRRAIAARDRIDRYAQIFTVLPDEQVDALVLGADGSARELARAAISRWVDPEETGDPVNDLLRVDTRMSLADDLLIIADHFSMRSSVEMRVPFLDLAFVELAERMPSRYKISLFGARKWLYRDAAARRLPVRLRRRLVGIRTLFAAKRGFSTPLSSWFVASDGPLANPDVWRSQLEQMAVLSQDALDDVLSPKMRKRHERQQSLMYSLAMWARNM